MVLSFSCCLSTTQRDKKKRDPDADLPDGHICCRGKKTTLQANQFSHMEKLQCLYIQTHKGSSTRMVPTLMRYNRRGCINGVACFRPWHRVPSGDKALMQHPIHSLVLRAENEAHRTRPHASSQYRGIIISERGEGLLFPPSQLITIPHFPPCRPSLPTPTNPNTPFC